MKNRNRKIGENVRKLASLKASRDAIPDGGGLADAIDFITDKQRFFESMKASVLWAFEAVDAVKSAPDNPYGDDDEKIAGGILDAINFGKRDR